MPPESAAVNSVNQRGSRDHDAAAVLIDPHGQNRLLGMADEELRQCYHDQLKYLEFAPSQNQLEPLLKEVGNNVARFFQDFSNASAKEEVEQSRAFRQGAGYSYFHQSYRVEKYQYLILPGKTESSWLEDRTDKNNRPLNTEASKGFMMSAGYVRCALYLHPSHQANSHFRYLGREDKKPRAYVIAFAQKPEVKDYLTEYFESASSNPVGLLVHGLFWVDPDSFQILRMYTRLLLPERMIKLKETTSDIFYGRVVFGETGQEFWLPREIRIEWELPNYKYTNRHKYSDYRFFTVKSDYKIIPPILKK